MRKILLGEVDLLNSLVDFVVVGVVVKAAAVASEFVAVEIVVAAFAVGVVAAEMKEVVVVGGRDSDPLCWALRLPA